MITSKDLKTKIIIIQKDLRFFLDWVKVSLFKIGKLDWISTIGKQFKNIVYLSNICKY